MLYFYQSLLRLPQTSLLLIFYICSFLSGAICLTQAGSESTISSLDELSDSSHDVDDDSFQESSQDLSRNSDNDPDRESDSEPDFDPDTDPDPDPDPDFELSEDEGSLSKEPVPEILLERISKKKGSYRLNESLVKIGVEISGRDPNDYQLSKTTMWKQITGLRERQRQLLHSALEDGDFKVVVQFDGKNYKRLNERHVGNQERLIVLCHSEHGDVPLGLFPLDSHSSFDCTKLVLDSIGKHSLGERLVGLVCDTEAVNTGRRNGVCVGLEKALNKSLLHLMCRHHIFETVLRCVFELVFGRSTGARINNFDTLKVHWHYLKNFGFRYAAMDDLDLEEPTIRTLAETAKDVVKSLANDHHFRNDYAELNDLVLKFLGVRTNKSFHVPGATNNARWMARAIYALKLYLFRNEVPDLDPEFLCSLRRFCLFVSVVYMKFWNWSSIAEDAPLNDIQFLKELDGYREIDSEIAAVALEAFQRHLWYLSDELILLSLFSKKVSAQEKNDICSMLIKTVGDRTENSIRYSRLIDNIQNLKLVDFISPRSWFFMHALNIDTGFMEEDPGIWSEFQIYRMAQKKVHDLIVAVNDSSERALQMGAKAIDGQRVKTESRLQDFVVSSYYK